MSKLADDRQALRDEFAKAALAGLLLQNGELGEIGGDKCLALRSYSIAEALMLEREQWIRARLEGQT